MSDVPQGVVFFLFCVAVFALLITVGIAGHATGRLDERNEAVEDDVAE